MRWKEKPRKFKTSGRQFAWYPIFCNEGFWVWLEFVDWQQSGPAYQRNYYMQTTGIREP